MAGPLLTITIQDQEVLVTLQKVTQKVLVAVASKLDSALVQVREDIFRSSAGKYLDPGTILAGVDQIGSAVIGFIEATDKPGLYLIVPSKARALRFISRSGELVHTRRVLHPFMKSTPTLAQRMAGLKPWLEDQLYDALIEAL